MNRDTRDAAICILVIILMVLFGLVLLAGIGNGDAVNYGRWSVSNGKYCLIQGDVIHFDQCVTVTPGR